MNREDVIRMAQECQLIGMRPHLDGIYEEALERFAALVAAQEREACAKTCEEEQFELTEDVSGKNGLQHFDAGCRSCAEMIRARGET